jgi:CRP-like cAMP-binding protein
MASAAASVAVHPLLEDVLSQLPVSATTWYGKGQMVYGPEDLSKSLYLVVEGNVGISQIAEDGKEVLLEIVRRDELFGESAFLRAPSRAEQAKVIAEARLMAWAVSDVEEMVKKRPPLAVALLQMLAQRNADLTRLIESLSTDSVERRLARSLLRFSERLGTPAEDGSVRMMPFSHAMLSRYIGTSREIVTQHMNRFRKRGYVTYTRQAIFLHRETLATVLD